MAHLLGGRFVSEALASRALNGPRSGPLAALLAAQTPRPHIVPAVLVVDAALDTDGTRPGAVRILSRGALDTARLRTLTTTGRARPPRLGLPLWVRSHRNLPPHNSLVMSRWRNTHSGRLAPRSHFATHSANGLRASRLGALPAAGRRRTDSFASKMRVPAIHAAFGALTAGCALRGHAVEGFRSHAGVRRAIHCTIGLTTTNLTANKRAGQALRALRLTRRDSTIRFAILLANGLGAIPKAMGHTAVPKRVRYQCGGCGGSCRRLAGSRCRRRRRLRRCCCHPGGRGANPGRCRLRCGVHDEWNNGRRGGGVADQNIIFVTDQVRGSGNQLELNVGSPGTRGESAHTNPSNRVVVERVSWVGLNGNPNLASKVHVHIPATAKATSLRESKQGKANTHGCQLLGAKKRF